MLVTELLHTYLFTGTDAKDQTCSGTSAKDRSYFFRAFFSFRATRTSLVRGNGTDATDQT